MLSGDIGEIHVFFTWIRAIRNGFRRVDTDGPMKIFQYPINIHRLFLGNMLITMFPCSNFKCPFNLHFMIYPRATEPYPCPLAVSPPALDVWAPSLLRSSWFLQAGISTSIHLHQNKSHDEEFSYGQLGLAEGAFFSRKWGISMFDDSSFSY